MCVCVGAYEQRVRVCAYACAHAPDASQRGRARVRVRVRAERRAAHGGDLYLGITVHMYGIICTRARMYTCMRAHVEGVSARAAGTGVH
jgi:hypothetical protein